MPRNIIPEIAKLLDLELGEEFKIKGSPDWMLFRFEECGLKVRNADGKVALSDGVDITLVERLLGGYLEIIKMPWKPCYRQKYWTFGLKAGIWVVVAREWEEYPAEYLLFKAGWVYRTERAACAALPGVAKEMDVEFMVKKHKKWRAQVKDEADE